MVLMTPILVLGKVIEESSWPSCPGVSGRFTHVRALFPFVRRLYSHPEHVNALLFASCMIVYASSHSSAEQVS